MGTQRMYVHPLALSFVWKSLRSSTTIWFQLHPIQTYMAIINLLSNFEKFRLVLIKITNVELTIIRVTCAQVLL
jgi:hypothetical protein